MNEQTYSVKVYCKGDREYSGSILIHGLSMSKAQLYVKDWIQAHTTNMVSFHKNGVNRWESRFTAIYIERDNYLLNQAFDN